MVIVVYRYQRIDLMNGHLIKLFSIYVIIIASFSAKTRTLLWSSIKCYLSRGFFLFLCRCSLNPPPPHRARVTVSVTDHWPVSQISQLIFYLDHSVSSGANTLLMLTDSATNYVWGWQFQWIIAALTNITTDICGWLLFPTLQFTSFLVTHLL